MRAIGALAAGLVLSWASAPLAQNWALPAVAVVPAAPSGASPQQVAFTRAVVQLRDGQQWAVVKYGIICGIAGRDTLAWKAEGSELETERLRAIFTDELKAAGLAGGEINLFEDQDASSNLQVAVLIKDMKAEFCGWIPPVSATMNYKGKVLMSAEWQLYDALNRKVLARIPAQSGGEEPRWDIDGVETAMFAAYRNNVKALLANEQFRGALLSRPEPASAPPPSGPLVFVGAPGDSRTAIGKAAESVVAIFAGAGSGSGVLISQDGYVLTNQHVVGSASRVKVRWADGAEGMADVVRVDPGRDVAVLKIDPRGRKPLALRGGAAALGETVFAVGTPLDAMFQGTVTRGIISSPRRAFEGRDYIQSDVTVNPGNSGGPLLDEQGAVIGLTVIGIRPNEAPSGINLFIPIDEAIRALNLQPQGKLAAG